MRKAGKILILLLCMMTCVSCAPGQGAQNEQAAAPGPSAEEKSGAEGQMLSEESGGEDAMPDGESAVEGQEPDMEDTKSDIEESDTQEEEFSPEKQMLEACSFCGWFDAFWADVDNDKNIEIVFSAEGTGCGAVGDSYKAIFKYKGHAIERMEPPSDLKEDYDCGLRVELVQEPVENVYSAYCPYFDELISFHGENVEGWEPPDSPQIAGGNARGFYNLCAAEYEGKKVLQASEYLYGEGGVVHNVATAQFLITWEKDGTPKVLKWWIE